MGPLPHNHPPKKRARDAGLARHFAPWLAGPAMLSAAVVGFLILRKAPLMAFGVIASVVLGVVMLWILISSLWPAQADRTCPGCKQDSLERIDPKTTMGVRCRACGFWDESLSGWFLAEEEEGPLEDLVLEQRQKGRARGRRPSPKRFGADTEAKAGRS